MSKIKLIIFDFDGVLVDSEYIAAQETIKILAQYGVNLDLETALKKFVGQTSDATAQYLGEKIGHAKVLDFKVKSKIGNRQAFKEQLVAFPNVIETLTQLEIPMCIGSNSAYDSLVAKLAITGLNQFFPSDKLYVGEMVAKPKPAPDVYLYAAEQQGIKPSECLVIEDSVHGVHAAIAANMRVIGYFGASHCYTNYDQLLMDAGAITTFKDMSKLSSILKKLQN